MIAPVKYGVISAYMASITGCRDLKITTGMAVHIKTNEKKEMESPP